MTEFKTTSPSAIRALRRSLGLSQSAFAIALGMTGANAKISVCRLESGERKPGKYTAYKLEELKKTLDKR